MTSFIVAALLLILLGLSYSQGYLGGRALAATGVRLHSRPRYHGILVAIWCLLPAILVLGAWALLGPGLMRGFVMSYLPPDVQELGPHQLNAAIRRVEAIASGYGVAGAMEPWETAAGVALRRMREFAFLVVIASAAGLGILGLLFARRRISPRLRARNSVEWLIRLLLLACSVVAVMTTLGIVVSLFNEAIQFFTFVHPFDFFFGTVWNPGFSTTGTAAIGQYGLLPLLWGTVMVAGIAMLVAVPIGLFTAIYLSQYASGRLRAVAKPVIEVLAGIPTIVYGFFALVTVGPYLSRVGSVLGIGINATSALTAGLVMGIMIIPFVSSLSDDIMRQVPRSLRDGSLGLGATPSETIRRVLLPAALPGIVGALLLAVSRAIGETMIVVLAAGNSPVLRFNPAEPVSTITVTIVNQLTGDSDFSGPQSLVAFALGLTLFLITLVLNMVALYIVRRFREQYE